MNKDIHETIRARLAAGEKFLLLSHIRPDGDAVGSLLGLGLSLRASGKQVEMMLEDGVPPNFRQLEGARDIVRKPTQRFDTLIVLDASDPQRVGNGYGFPQPDIQIDHHVTNLNFAKINLVVPEAVATSAILAEFIPEWGFTLTPSAASALLAGIITDSIGFRTSNMNPQALRLSADLMERGANLPELYFTTLVQRSFEAARYWGVGLTGLQREDRLIWTTLSQADRIAVGYNGNDDADLSNMLSSIQDCDIAVLFIEQKNKRVKVSWRSSPRIDVSQIAFEFGGGGHPAASGADIDGTLEEVQAKVLNATRQLLLLSGSLGNKDQSILNNI